MEKGYSGILGVGGGNCIQQMEAGNRAAGAVRIAFGVGYDERRSSRSFYNARCQYSQHAAMPLWIVKNQALTRVSAIGIDLFKQFVIDTVQCP